MFHLSVKSLIMYFRNLRELSQKILCLRGCCVISLMKYSNLCLLTTHWSNFSYTHTPKNPPNSIIYYIVPFLFSCTFLKFISQILFFPFVPSLSLFSGLFYRQVTEQKTNKKIIKKILFSSFLLEQWLSALQYHCSVLTTEVAITGFMVWYFSSKFSLRLLFLNLLLTNSCTSLSCFTVMFLKLGYLCTT